MTVTTFFSHTDQTFVVPAGVTSIAVHIVGASGGGTNSTLHPAGWGPVFDGVLAVTPGETLTVQPGQNGGGAGGSSQAGTGTAGYPDGGTGGVGPANNRGGGGGGSSRIWRSGVGGTLVVLVAGGGGVAARETSPNPGTGNGGVPIGQTTTGGPAATGNGEGGFPTFARGGKGATPSVGGAGGLFGTVNGSAGGFMAGGNGAAGTGSGTGVGAIQSGGGGGGGYYGGGGGASGTGLFVPGGCGGGGSSYINLAGWSGTTWDTTVPTDTLFGAIASRDGQITFTYDLPVTGGEWSLGLVARLGGTVASLFEFITLPHTSASNTEKRLAFDGTNVWLATGLAQNLLRIDNPAMTYTGFTVTHSGDIPYLLHYAYGYLWAVDQFGVSKVNPANGSVVNWFPIPTTYAPGPGPVGITSADGYVWLAVQGTTFGGSWVARLNPTTGSWLEFAPLDWTQIGAAGVHGGVAVGGGYVWVIGGSDKTYARITISTGIVTYYNYTSQGNALQGYQPMVSTGTRIWWPLEHVLQTKLRRINTATGSFTEIWESPANRLPGFITFEGGYVWLIGSTGTDAYFIRINPVTDAVVERPLVPLVGLVDITFDGTFVWLHGSDMLVKVTL